MPIYRNYERQDFSYLLKNTEREVENKDITQSSLDENSQINYEKMRLDKLANPKMKYAYSNFNYIYHDRECGAVKNIPDDEFEMAECFSDVYNWCSNCYKFAVIRCGIQNNEKRFKQYVNYFKTVRAGEGILHFLIVENNAKLWLLSDNLMEFQIKDDRWRISVRNDNITLLHNNYYIDRFGKRIFEKSFHIQFESTRSFSSCVNYMVNYSCERHIAEYIEKQNNRQERIQNENSDNVLPKNYFHMKNYYPLSEKLIYLDCENYIADDYFIKYNVKIKFLKEYIIPDTKYRWIICKVSKKHLIDFTRAMKEAGEKIFSEGNFDYYTKLKESSNMYN